MHPLSDRLARQAHRRAAAAGIRGNTGGWVTLPGARVQGWWSVADWAIRRTHRGTYPDNLREIVEGRRIGTPTLRTDDADEFAAGVLSPGPVCWRKPDA